MTDPDEADLSARQPIRVVEQSVTQFQWDTWRDASEEAAGDANTQAILLGLLAAVVAGAVGYSVTDGASRSSVLLYSPFLGLAVWYVLRSRLDDRNLRRLSEEMRAVVVPKLVHEISDEALTRLARLGGVVVSTESVVIVAERRESDVLLVASEYDMSKAVNWPPLWIAGDGVG